MPLITLTAQDSCAWSCLAGHLFGAVHPICRALPRPWAPGLARVRGPRSAGAEPTAGFMNSTFNDDANFVHSRFNVSDFSATKFNEETKFNDAQFAGISSNT